MEDKVGFTASFGGAVVGVYDEFLRMVFEESDLNCFCSCFR